MPLKVIKKTPAAPPEAEQDLVLIDTDLRIVATCSMQLDEDSTGGKLRAYLETLSLEELYAGYKFASFCVEHCSIPALRGDDLIILHAIQDTAQSKIHGKQVVKH